MNKTFDHTEDLLKFLLEVAGFKDWEVITLRLTSSNGLDVNINTKIIGADNEYSLLKDGIYQMIIDFYNNFIQNYNNTISYDIKLRLPYDIKKSLDPDEEYLSFNLRFYSNGEMQFLNSSFVEKYEDSSLAVLQSWEIYCNQIYELWKNK